MHKKCLETTEDQSAEAELGQWSSVVGDWLLTWSDDMRTTAFRHVTPRDVVPHILGLMRRKEVNYDASWAKRGVLGYWLGCMARQQDRVDPGFFKLMSAPGADVDSPVSKRIAKSLIGTLGDIANYALMGICLLASMYPDEYDEWVEELDQDN